MNLLDGQRVAHAGDLTAGDNSPPASDVIGVTSMNNASSDAHAVSIDSIDPHSGARAIVRLIQCTFCSRPLRNPYTLQCGNSLCKACLPETYHRPSIPFLVTSQPQEVFKCPFETCGLEHSLEKSIQDVTFSKLLDRVSAEVAKHRLLAVDTPTQLEAGLQEKESANVLEGKQPPLSKIVNGGRLVATYTLAELGELKYDSDLSYRTLSPKEDSYETLDTALLANMKEATKAELDCHVCFGLMLDPLTTNCGHTFCRGCVARVLDHTTMCPICRRTLTIPPTLHGVPSNHRLNQILNGLCPDLVALRAEVAKNEESVLFSEKNVPLFVCSLAYPSMPCFLHIFEPRYRLMIRRAIESGDRKFGMIMYNQSCEPQGEFGNVHFMLYGTLLHINRLELLSDGRSLIETRGLSKFRVKSYGQLDGYMVGDIEHMDDMSLDEEEHIESIEVSTPAPAQSDLVGQLNHMSSLDLLKIGTEFISRMQAASAPWLHSRVLHSYGPPPSEPALFPYWFASILPIAEGEKYKLLLTRSARERLKICANWIRRIEAQRW